MGDIDIFLIWNKAIDDGGSVAMWRLPHSEAIHFLADLSGQPIKGALDLENSRFGFAVSPFLNSEGDETLFLNANIYSVFTVDDLSLGDGVVNYHDNGKLVDDESGRRGHFMKMVDAVVEGIAAGNFEKVVPSRTMDVSLPDKFNLFRLFAEMSEAHPAAFVSLVSIPGIGTWIGASPEMLVESSEKHFRTVSLAGTQAYVDDIDLSEAAWTQKEIEEQAMVSRYIIEQFKTIRLRDFVESGPETVRAGNMIHLKTEYCVDLNEIELSDLGSVMLQLLHPTSAVCGMPRGAALEFIAANEKMDRGLYSGYLGPVNMDGTTRLYVNLRCMQICGKRAVLYAGAGVTHSSTAEKEWDETMLKCQDLLDVIRL